MVMFVARRLIHLIPVLLVVTFLIYALLLLVPGDPTFAILGEFASQADRDAMRVQLGLDQPIVIQYLRWLGSLLTGDLGLSLRNREPVIDMLLARIPVTLELTVLALLLSVVVGVPLGIVAALNRNKPIDGIISTIGIAGVALPSFWAGILLITLLSLTWRLLPASGYIPIWVDPIANLRLMIMPSLMVGASLTALILRQTRASMLQVLSQDYVRTARAKGVGEFQVIVSHALRNALVPIVTIIGLQFGSLIGGVVVTEMIFVMPGLGRMIVESIFQRDFAPLQGAMLFVVIGTLLVNLITDIIYAVVDKRVKL